MDLRQRVQAYLNKTGITQVEFCKRAGNLDRSRFSRQLGSRGFYNKQDVEKIEKFLKSCEGPAIKVKTRGLTIAT